MARKAQQAGIRVFVLGIGSTQGAPIQWEMVAICKIKMVEL